MGKNDFLTPKAIANRIKAKGLQKLRWYCQMCQKQCRDENGFKCHCMSESHQRQMLVFGQNPTRVIEGYSEEFETGFLDLMRRSHRFSRVAATVVYNEYIHDRHHVHMNSTEWATLTEFIKYLGKKGLLKVEETPKGWFITYVDRDSETMFKEKLKNKRARADMVEEEKNEREIRKQIEKAAELQLTVVKSEGNDVNVEEEERPAKEIKLEGGLKVGFALGSKGGKDKGEGPSRVVFEEVEEKVRKSVGGEKSGKSALDDLMREEEKAKERANRKDYWLCEGIVVKVMSKELIEKGYYKQKGIVRKVIDKYVGEIEMLENKHKLRVDQNELETVIPQIGALVKIVNGAYRGSKARLLGVDTEKFCAKLQIEKGIYDGRMLKAIEYEDICKVAYDFFEEALDMCFFGAATFCSYSQGFFEEAFHFCKLIPNPTLSTFNMLMSVCAYARDSEGGFQVLKLSQKAGFNPDCNLYTTLISTCAKSGKVDSMFEVFHQIVNAGVQPDIHTYGALIDGCARAGQVAKAFGAYGIMRSKNVKPDGVIFNALITACGQSGAVDHAFDVLAEMRGELQPIDPDHITVGALMTACAKAGQVGRAQEVYNMIDEYNIKGTPEVYTIAISCCSQAGDWEFATKVYDDMTRKGVMPDEMFLSSMIDVAGHAGKVDAAFEVLQNARIQGQQPGIMTDSSLMGACSNGKNWQRALELYEDMKSIRLKPTVPTMNALITALCDGDQLPKATEVLTEMKGFGLCPNTITYSILFVASERKDDLDIGLMLLDQARRDNIHPNHIMYKCLLGMCLRRYQKACSLGEPVLSFESGGPQIENKWTSLALKIYRETMAAAEKPPVEVVSQVLGCLQFPCDASLKDRLIEDLGVTADSPRHSNLFSPVDGFGQYDPRAFSLFEEASSLGIIPCITFKQNHVVVDAKRLQPRIAEVYVLTVFKGLKHRLAAGAKLPNVNILLPVEEAQTMTSEGEKTIHVSSRVSQGITSLLRRIGLPYQGNESYGKIRINGISLRRWLQPKLTFPFTGKPGEFSSSQARLGQGITLQQRDIRTGDFALY